MLAVYNKETLIYLPRLSEGRQEISEKSFRKITMLDNWNEQRKIWGEIGFPNLIQNE
jgi:hypothetical protein